VREPDPRAHTVYNQRMDITAPTSKLRVTAVAVAAVAAGALAAPSIASATLPSADAGEYCIEGYQGSYSGPLLGYACFFPSTNLLTVHDRARDGHGAHAELVYGTSTATIGDPDGAQSGYGKKTVKVPKGQVPHVRLCVTGLGCTKYKVPARP
jgi:hypothetical protein